MTRALWLLLAACSPAFPSETDNGTCSVDGTITVERIAAWHPSCNGAKYATECQTRYGVDRGCDLPYLRNGASCRVRTSVLEGCTAMGDIVCCP